MTYLIVKWKGRKKYKQYHPNRASALRTKKFLGKMEQGEYARIETDSGKQSKSRKSRRSSSINIFNLRLPRF